MPRISNDTDLIVKLIKEQDEKRNIQIKGLHKNMESSFEAFNIKLDSINNEHKEMLDAIKAQNGEIKEIKKDTRIWRFMHKNPKLSFILIGILFSGIVGILGYLNEEEIKEVVKKIIGL